MRLKKPFFERNTLIVAKELLGKYLVRKIGDKVISAKITETEAYHGPKDLASHASKGRTPRTAVMFGPAGYSYVYLVYGMYHCFNIVTGRDGFPSAVLIRASEEIQNVKVKNQNDNSKLKMNGPGKLCRELKINQLLNGIDLATSSELWVEDHSEQMKKIKQTPRIGVDYAKEYKDKPWRFVLESK